MKLFYNVTGPRRKSLAAAIRQELNTPSEYLGAPTFAYRVGGYHIDKNGVVTGKDNPDLKSALYREGFSAEECVFDEPDTLEIGLESMEAASSTEKPQEDTLTIEMPLEGFTEENIANLEKLIASKALLIKKAIGIEALPIERTETTLRFPWFPFDTPGEEVDAYSRLISALYTTAKKQRRVTAKEHPVDNEKFAFRVFLIRLGFVGDEYKAARKILLRNLNGNSAFKVIPKLEEVDDHE